MEGQHASLFLDELESPESSQPVDAEMIVSGQPLGDAGAVAANDTAQQTEAAIVDD